MIQENEIPKHLKKKQSNTSKSRNKADHKHTVVECLLIKDGRPHLGSYCGVCGKIHNWAWCTEKLENGCYRMLRDEEIFEKYKELERFEIADLWQKFIPVPIRKEEL